MKIIEKTYNPRNIEQSLYAFWEKQGYFKPNGDKTKESFCIMMPPPNVTGSLHMGHAFQQTIMDIMIRYHRMQGKNTLWQVGTDHAGIATQLLVEHNTINEEGKSRYDYSRDDFIKKIWKWKEKYGSLITQQMRRLGNSVDWERERFTMDKGISNAVKEVFIRLCKENLIYRGKRLVNWDPKLHTAISDLEVVSHKSKGFIWYIRYPLADSEKTADGVDYLVVATTRPETMLGDTGIAVNPKDPRYQSVIGKFVTVPLINRRIPIIGDSYANMEKGTGCVKIAPAHDFNDYEVGHRHQLPMVNVLTTDGTIRESAEIFDTKGNKSDIYPTNIPVKFQKLERFLARKLIIDDIAAIGFLEKTKSYETFIYYSDRSGVAIEPMLTDQWYVRTNILAKPAVEAVKNGEIRFVSKKYETMYFSWMEDIRDWCISRQLWWGHRIPAWYDEKKNVYVGRNEEEVRYENNLSSDTLLYQDEDVLDTWFSSSLWTFSSLGWPENTDAIHQFHPTNIIVSGFDIIFFWIARMIMMTMHFVKDKNGKPQVPFKIIYITGLICDDEGKKMSKSNGNIIDPLDIVDGISIKDLIEKRTANMIHPQKANKVRKSTKKQFPNCIEPHGTDALRFMLAVLASGDRDIKWDIKRLKGYRNFCNKLWNASRFVLMKIKDQDCKYSAGKKVLLLVDRWILSEFNETVKTYREALDNFRFDVAAGILYEFIWNQFCDWYIEIVKVLERNISKEELQGTYHTLIFVLESILRLAHPIIPFITETIWQHVKIIAGINADTIMLQPFPEFDKILVDKSASSDIEWIKQVIIVVRTMRAEMKISPRKPLELFFRDCTHTVIQRLNQKFVQNMAYLERITILSENEKIPISITKFMEDAELLIPIKSLLDKGSNLEYIKNYQKKEIVKVELEILQIKNKLKNKSFLVHAPEAIVAMEKNKLAFYSRIKVKLVRQQEIIASYNIT